MISKHSEPDGRLSVADMNALLAMTPERLADVLGGVAGALKCKCGPAMASELVIAAGLRIQPIDGARA